MKMDIPTKRCQNCGLACNGMFCCEWCMNAYLARRDAHRIARRRPARSQPNEGKVPETGQDGTGGCSFASHDQRRAEARRI